MSYATSFSSLLPLCVLVILLGSALAQLPVPQRPSGHPWGNPSAPILIEMFADFECIDSRRAWPIVRSVLAHYEGTGAFHFVYHQFPLITHYQAYGVAMAAEIITNYTKTDFYSLSDFLYESQPQFTNDAFYFKSRDDLYQLLGGWALKYGVSNSTFFENMQWHSAAYDAVGLSLRLGHLRQVYGTPWFTVNGFTNLNLSSETTKEQWITYIDSLSN